MKENEEFPLKGEFRDRYIEERQPHWRKFSNLKRRYLMEYSMAIEPFDDEYFKAVEKLDYNDPARKPFIEKRKNQTEPFYKEYEKKIKPVLDAYETATKEIIARLLKEQNSKKDPSILGNTVT